MCLCIPLKVVVERDFLAAPNVLCREETNPTFAEDTPLLNVGVGVAAVVAEARLVALEVRIDGLFPGQRHEVHAFLIPHTVYIFSNLKHSIAEQLTHIFDDEGICGYILGSKESIAFPCASVSHFDTHTLLLLESHVCAALAEPALARGAFHKASSIRARWTAHLTQEPVHTHTHTHTPGALGETERRISPGTPKIYERTFACVSVPDAQFVSEMQREQFLIGVFLFLSLSLSQSVTCHQIDIHAHNVRMNVM